MSEKKDTSKDKESKKPDGPACINSNQLFGKNKSIEIIHLGETYKLQITRQGKLILTK